MANNNEKFYLIDTNALFKYPYLLQEYKVVIPSHVLREVEHLELTRKSDKQLQYDIRQFKKALDENKHIHVDLKDYKFTLRDEWDGMYTDNLLVQICVDEGYGILTSDRLLKDKCRLYGVEVVDLEEKDDFIEYKGFKVIRIDEESHIESLINDDVNSYNLIINEYAVIDRESDGELLDIVKWTGESLVSLIDSKGRMGQSVTSEQFGTITPKDEYQAMAIDSILSNQVTVLRGSAGSGKSLLALNTAWQLVESEGYKLVVFIQAQPVKDASELGYFKGSKLEKILQSFPTLESKFGDEFVIQQFIEEGKLEFHSFSHLRGYDTGDSKVCVWIPEAQNLSIELLRLGGQRISENTKLILDGDYNTQIDSTVFERDNGMKRISEVLRGEDLYGEIALQNVYRSRLADLLIKCN